MIKKLNKQKKIFLFDAHEDISDAALYLGQKDFFSSQRSKNFFSQVNWRQLRTTKTKGIFAVSCPVLLSKGKVLPHPNHFEELLKHLNFYHNLIRQSQGRIKLIKNKRDLIGWRDDNIIRFLLALEGADSIDSNTRLEVIYNLGIRSLGLVYNHKNKLGGGFQSRLGLTKLGQKIIRQAEKLGIAIDLSHANEKTFYQALKFSRKPLFVSHSGCRALFNHPRNLKDEQIIALAKKGGVMGIFAVAKFLGGNTLKDLVRHYLHAIKLVGPERVILGTDLGALPSESLLKDFFQFSHITKLLKELKRAGLKESELKRIVYKNLIDFLNIVLV
jgi:membrane dipeptidase